MPMNVPLSISGPVMNIKLALKLMLINIGWLWASHNKLYMHYHNSLLLITLINY